MGWYRKEGKECGEIWREKRVEGGGGRDELLARSQFPVFTLYAQKVCLSADAPLCASPWAFESVPDLALSHFIEEEKTHIAESRTECVEACMLETSFSCRRSSQSSQLAGVTDFPPHPEERLVTACLGWWRFKSITYHNTTKECVLSRANRNMVGRRPLLDVSIGAVYVEVACVPQLHEMCMKANFTCHSFDFMSAGEKICRLSHHSSSTLAHIQEPYLLLDNSTTYERHACYQVSVECRAAEMLAHISTSTIFDGKIYSRERPNSCRVDVNSSTEFSITLPYNDMKCGVAQDPPSTFTSNIVIQILDPNSPYEIFVRELVAMDGEDNAEILLIDGNGCPTDPTIMQKVVQLNGSGKILLAPFQAFKFPSSEMVQFRGLVTPCFPKCEPVQCQVPSFDGVSRSRFSFGKRKRREVQEADVLVVQSVHITDKFEFSAKQRKENEVSVEAQGSCSSFTGVVVAGALFLAAQLVMLMAWSYLWHKKRATKQIDPTPPTPSLYHMGSSASRASSTSYLTD
ncbi:hypothetical protein E2C01_033319 [Portunus trituberculatus]|uniref:ZP domain-containing protein n=1 Tax=Portunus trituberculatus TaxID=210409 RepID=A0A5B7EXJ8_PORTR|nr:hypothetical protein [Portunus trituberculatus]